MQKGRKLAITTIVFTLSLGLVIGAGYYKSSIGDGGSFNLNLPQKDTGKVKTVTVNLDEQGLLKKLLQPDLIEVRSHAITNKSNKDYNLQFELTDNSLPVRMSVKDDAWDEKNNTLNRPLKPGQKVNFNMYFDVSKELFNASEIYDGRLNVLDFTTKEQLGYVPIKIVNTNMASDGNKDCCAP
ncbi:hypothetical protein [Desulfitobacterium sp. PCE1]|uniref:hypothetical protein n=1 Tax=Desulfitobacterium sp. PCE1 TaxID=146907 RepID=UPI0003810BDC|nr:hypothetical protein [Desulfitobacterium sp. PCE1]